MARSLFLFSSLSPSQLLFPTYTIKSPFSSPLLALHSPTPATHLSAHSSPAAHRLRGSHFFYSAVSFSISGGLPTLNPEDNNWKPDEREALRGGEQVTSVLEEIIKLLVDMDMDEASESVALEIATQGVIIGKRVDEMESGFMMALDYMIQLAEKDNDEMVTDQMPHQAQVTSGGH